VHVQIHKKCEKRVNEERSKEEHRAKWKAMMWM